MKKSLLLIGGLSLGLTQAQAQCPSGETQVTIQINLDRYGTETTWEATGPGGSPVYASGGPYTDATANGVRPQTPVLICVPDNTQLIVTVDDSYGDGMCCAYGAGGYSVLVAGNEVASGGTFATTQSSSVFIGSDLGLGTLGLESVVAQGAVTISGTVVNTGITPVTGFTLSYSVDGGAAESTEISATLQPGDVYTYNHPTPWNATVGNHTLNVSISGMNSDGVANNNSYDGTIGVASQSVDRITIIEQFTSSTCPPCASLNTTFGPTLSGLNTNDLGSNVSAIKYHMNWPSPGNDPSYNPDGNTRKSYYGVSGIPDLFIDGKPMTATSALYIQDQADRDAFLNLGLSYTLVGNQITVTADVTPYATFTGAHKLHVGIVENSYAYAASTTTQDEFHYVQRKMMPNGQGTNLATLTGDQTQTFNLSHTITLGGPAQGNYNTWGQNLENLTVVAFVQNTSTKNILQANFLPVLLNVGVNENSLDQRLLVFPNPTEGLLNVQYEAPKTGVAQIEVINVLGERVFEATRSMAAGTQRETLDMTSLSDGIYFVNITADGVRASRKVTLNK
ncbi:MAG: Omp28-related outer membrane protein [Flavobacteriales bacterium]|jgi:hypothetical protein|nr:Omp28-related outer membrane protein [Flavobacteriales bacterium]